VQKTALTYCGKVEIATENFKKMKKNNGFSLKKMKIRGFY